MLIWSRHNRPGPAVAQSPHNNPPRPRLSPLLPPPAARPAQCRTPGSAEPRSTPPPVSLRPAGRFRPLGGRERGLRGAGGVGGREAPIADRQGNPHRAVTKSPQRRGRLSGFLPRGRSGARAEAPVRERDSLPSPGGRNAASVRKGRRDPRRPSPESGPSFFRGGCGADRAPVGTRPSSGIAAGWLPGYRASPPASCCCLVLAGGRVWQWKQGGLRGPRPSRPET